VARYEIVFTNLSWRGSVVRTSSSKSGEKVGGWEKKVGLFSGGEKVGGWEKKVGLFSGGEKVGTSGGEKVGV